MMAPAATYRRRAFRLVLAVAICVAPTLANAPTVLALPAGSQNVAYVYDFGFGSPGSKSCTVNAGGVGINDLHPPGPGAPNLPNSRARGSIRAGKPRDPRGGHFPQLPAAARGAG